MPRGAQLDPKVVAFQHPGFLGGINLRDSVPALGKDEGRILENGVLDQAGGFSKRLGCESHGTFGSSGDRVLSMYTFYRGPGVSPQLLINTTAGKLYYTNDPGAATITWTQIATGLSTSAPFSYETFNSKCYVSNGVDNYASWDGSTWTTFASAPKGKFLRLWKDTMFVAGVSGTPDRVFESNAGDAETFGASAWVDIAKGDGDQVIALSTDGNVLIVAKRDRTFVIIDPTALTNRVLDFEKGAESHFSFVTYDGSIFFLSRHGVCEWLSDGPARFISGKIEPIFDSKVVNLNALAAAYGYVFENRCGWAIPEASSAIPTMQLEYYPRLGAISLFGSRAVGPWTTQRMPATCFATYRSGVNEYLMCSHSSSNKVLRAFAPSVGTDVGVAFGALLESGPIGFDSPIKTKYIDEVRMLGRGKFTFILKRDFENNIYKTHVIDLTAASDTWTVVDTWGTGTWAEFTPLKEKRLNTDAYGIWFQFLLTDGESTISKNVVEVGSVQYSLDAGAWGIYQVVLQASVLGERT